MKRNTYILALALTSLTVFAGVAAAHDNPFPEDYDYWNTSFAGAFEIEYDGVTDESVFPEDYDGQSATPNTTPGIITMLAAHDYDLFPEDYTHFSHCQLMEMERERMMTASRTLK